MGCVVREVPLPAEWDLLSSLSSTAGEGTNMFLPFLRTDVRLFADRLTGFLNGQFRSADNYMKMLQARYQFLQLILSQVFDKCDVILIGTVFDGVGLPLIAFPYGMGVDAATGLTVPRGAISVRRRSGRGGCWRSSPPTRRSPTTTSGDHPTPTITARALSAAVPYKVPADYDATDET